MQRTTRIIQSATQQALRRTRTACVSAAIQIPHSASASASASPSPSLSRSFHTSPSSSFTLTSSSLNDSPSTHPSLNTFSSEEQMLREAVSNFARSKIGPLVAKMDEEGKMDPSVIAGCFEQGLMGIEVPAEYGGGGMSFTQACIVIEELAKVDPSVSVMVDVQNTLINNAFIKYGSDQIKKTWLPRLATDTLASFCLSEASSGSDAFALKTTAIKQPDGTYKINGSKMWITNAAEAGVYVVFANVDPSKGYKGITAFVVPRDAKGFTVGKKENKLGIRASSTCELAFDDVVVTKEQILGKEGEGYKIAIGALNEGRIGIGAQMLGCAVGAFEAAMPYIHQRKQFGQPIATFQGMQFTMAECATEIECARLLVYNAARMKEEGLPFIQQAAMAKLKASVVAGKVSSQAIEWMGGVGFTREAGVEKFYRDAKIGVIYEGTTNLQLVTIAKHISSQYTQK